VKNKHYANAIGFCFLGGLVAGLYWWWITPGPTWNELEVMDREGVEINCSHIQEAVDASTIQTQEESRRYAFKQCRDEIAMFDKHNCQRVNQVRAAQIFDGRTVIYRGMEIDKRICKVQWQTLLTSKADTLELREQPRGKLLYLKNKRLLIKVSDIKSISDAVNVDGAYFIEIVHHNIQTKELQTTRIMFDGIKSLMAGELLIHGDRR
jgi:hypothetical protein